MLRWSHRHGKRLPWWRKGHLIHELTGFKTVKWKAEPECNLFQQYMKKKSMNYNYIAALQKQNREYSNACICTQQSDLFTDNKTTKDTGQLWLMTT